MQKEVDIYDNINLGKLYREQGNANLSIRAFKYLLSKVSCQESPFLYNLILNELEISEKKIFLSSKPRQLGVNLTHRCNINCITCFYSRTPWDIPARTVQEIKDYLPYLQRVFWQGGEPFVSPHFEELFEKASTYSNLRQTIVTNGLLIDNAWVERLVRNKVVIIYSIDGVTKETYEFIRRGARFDDIIESLNILNKYRKNYFGDNFASFDFELIMQVTIMKYNYREMGQLVDFAKEYNFDGLNIIPIQNVSGPENIFLHKDEEALGYIGRTLPCIKRECRRHGIRLYIQLPQIKKSDVSLLKFSAKKKQSSKSVINRVRNNGLLCYWPWESLFILFEGKVKPYGFCRKDVEWNLSENSLDQIWNNKTMQLYRQNLIENRYLDFCDPRCSSGIISKDLLGREIK